MSRKKRGFSKIWIMIGVVLFVIMCVCLLGIVMVEIMGRQASKSQVDNRLIPTLAPTATDSPTATSIYHKDVRVVLNDPNSLNDEVGLWLVLDDCDIDVVYNYVPNGTIATLTGKMCHGYAIPRGEGDFYEVRFSSDIEGLQGDNFWVDEEDMSIRK